VKRASLILVAALLLAGCGARELLQPAAGTSMPPKPAMAKTTPTVAELLTPTTQQRPGRSEELLLRSEERPDDHFDLPPPG
jgi:PBP1b-binding outer membrane lipoprotein LpoB